MGQVARASGMGRTPGLTPLFGFQPNIASPEGTPTLGASGAGGVRDFRSSHGYLRRAMGILVHSTAASGLSLDGGAEAPEGQLDTGSPPEMSARTRVLVLEKSDLRRAGILDLLAENPAVEVVGVARSLNEACRLLSLAPSDFQPNVVVVGCPTDDALAALMCRTLKDRVPDAAIVVIADEPGPPTPGVVLRAGARGYLLNERVPAGLAACVSAAAAGATFLDPEATEVILSETPVRDANARASSADGATGGVLTEREMAALDLVAAGLSNQQIARRLSVSQGTIKAAIQGVLRKLGAENRTEATSTALRGALIDPLSRGENGAAPQAADEPLSAAAPDRAPIRVAVIGPESLLERGLRSTLTCKDDFELVGTSATVEGASLLLASESIDVVVLVNATNVGSLVEPIRAADAAILHIPTGNRSAESIPSLDSCVLLEPDVSAASLVASIRTAAAHSNITPPRSEDIGEALPPLSDVELRVLGLLTRGATNAEIAGELNTSIPAVKGIFTRLFHKLDVRNRAQAAAVALRSGIRVRGA